MKTNNTRPLIDGAGHVDPQLAEGLRERAAPEAAPRESGFLDSSVHSLDPLAEQMGESVIESVTSGEDAEPDPADDSLETLADRYAESGVDAEPGDDDDTLRLRRALATAGTARGNRE
ncbi:MAG: hypothetical protein J0L92_31790 [Deltaproteobacteria bacterium]|nr:hypothetical protein [Deltaproteobacteria bacterium]